MPYSANGTYTAPQNSFNTAVAGTSIIAADWITLLADLTSALTTVGQSGSIFTQSGIGTLTPLARTMQAKGRELITSADFTGAPVGLTGVGTSVLSSITTAIGETAFGFHALKSQSTRGGNTAIGYNAMNGATAAANNVVIGYGAFSSITTDNGADNNVLIGYSAGLDAAPSAQGGGQTYQENVFIGTNAGKSLVHGSQNTFVGTYAGATENAAEATGLTLIGFSAGTTQNGALQTTAIGFQALKALTNGNYNLAIGCNAAVLNTTGLQNTVVGTGTFQTSVTGDNNAAFGFLSMGTANGASQNSCFGSSAGSSITTGSNLTCIGYNAQPSAVNATNEVTIGNTSVTSYRMFGTVDISASTAGQIKFPAMQNASAGANTLDDYEEGTWTPTVTSGTGTFTSVAGAGTYTKIGDLVTWHVDITITTNGTAATDAEFTGPPFTPANYSESVGRETAVTGAMLFCYQSSGAGTFTITKFDGTYPGGDGRVLRVNGFFYV